MKSHDRARLAAALRDHVGKIAADLRAKMRAPGDTRRRAQQLHADEKVAEDFDVWTDLLSRRAAVLWVLKSVYVRVLEDRGLLTPGRLLDQEAQQLFERLAPHLGETAFLRWVYRDLASSHGGLPELFSPQPAEVALPSDELSRTLIAFWRHRDADTGATWGFAEERFEGELMGDLYQELDPVVKDRFALCQTPDFVRAFILDRTLTPAIESFGADEVRLLDPACGSGHFLIDGLKRLVAATAAKHPDWEGGKVVDHALDRVVGVDLNDYACALARARLIMTAAEMAGVTSLAAAARFHPHVYWADGLEQVEREEQKPALQYALFEKVEEKPRATLTRSDVRAALKAVVATRFHAVVANPPYIVESDDARKAYHREALGRRRRYVSAYRQYSLASPFTERCFQLALEDAYVGLITSNNFMKREFGKPLVEQVLAGLDLALIMDTSQAYIPFHGTPTVLLFARNRRPTGDTVRVGMGRRSESGIPIDPARGRVWLSITEGWATSGFENDYLSVAEVPRTTLSKHPWSLGGGGAAELKERLDAAAGTKLGKRASAVGPMCITKQDGLFSQPTGVLSRCGVADRDRRPYVSGDNLRDWCVEVNEEVVFPYDDKAIAKPLTELDGVGRFLWPWRTVLGARAVFGGGTFRSSGRQWWEYGQMPSDRIATPLSIAFSFVASQNHFVLDRGGRVFNRSAPVIKLPPGATEDDHLSLLALLNSSTACFWMKQVFHPKGATSANRNHPDPERFAHEFAATGLESFPIPKLDGHEAELVRLGRALDELGQQRTRQLEATAWTSSLSTTAALRDAFTARWREHDDARQQMIVLQEDLDWLVYFLFGVTDSWLRAPVNGHGRLSRGQRAFERVNGRRSFVRDSGALVSPAEAEAETGEEELPPEYREITARREHEIRSNPAVALIETYMHKRLWRDSEENIRESEYRKHLDSQQLRLWVLDRVEHVAAARKAASTSVRLVGDLIEDRELQVVAEVFASSGSYSLDALVSQALAENAVPNHPLHVYTDSGVGKRAVWDHVWALQRREDAGERLDDIPVPPEYSQGSRGKSTDFLRNEYWRHRGPLDVPRERFVAFTEVPGRSGVETLYGWVGWTAQQRVKAILAIDEELEDAAVPLADRIGLLDSAWRLLPVLAREDAAAATRLKAEIQALVGPEGPSRELIEEWKKRFPPPTTRATRTNRAAAARVEDDSDTEETDES